MASDSASPATATRHWGRAFGLGPRRLSIAAAAALAMAATVIAVVLVSGGGSHHRRTAASLRYGKIRSWLPKPTTPTDQVVTARAAHPVLAAVEGNTVKAQLDAGSTYVTAVGPAIPAWVSSEIQRGRFSDERGAPSTFKVTFASSRGVVGLTARSFSILTNQGQVVRPSVTGPGGHLPTRVPAGKPLTLTVRTDLSEGEGELRWAPDERRVLVAWTYQLELD